MSNRNPELVSAWEMHRVRVEATNDGKVQIVGDDGEGGEPCVTIAYEQVDALIEWLEFAKNAAIESLANEGDAPEHGGI